MTSRILPPDEWEKLAGTEAEALWPHLDPDNSRVLVVEDGDRIVATWTALRVVHLECVWIDPEYRGAFGVVKRLLRGVREIAKGWGARTVVTSAMTDQVRALAKSLHGTPLPGEHYVMPMESLCQPQ